MCSERSEVAVGSALKELFVAGFGNNPKNQRRAAASCLWVHILGLRERESLAPADGNNRAAGSQARGYTPVLLQRRYTTATLITRVRSTFA